jgi:hypothetical protein
MLFDRYRTWMFIESSYFIVEHWNAQYSILLFKIQTKPITKTNWENVSTHHFLHLVKFVLSCLVRLRTSTHIDIRRYVLTHVWHVHRRTSTCAVRRRLKSVWFMLVFFLKIIFCNPQIAVSKTWVIVCEFCHPLTFSFFSNAHQCRFHSSRLKTAIFNGFNDQLTAEHWAQLSMRICEQCGSYELRTV